MPAALISQMSAPPGEDEAFDRWYAEEHIPLRMAIPGFSGAVRAWAVEGEPAHLAIYHLEGTEVLSTAAYREVKERPSPTTRHMLESVAAFTRWTGEEISDTGEAPGARYLYVVTFAVPLDRQAEFDAWYVDDHVPELMASEHWVRCRRYAVAPGGEPADVTRIAVHEMHDLAGLQSPERARARASEWRARLAEEPWFGSARYAVYERSADFVPTGSS